MRMFISYSDGFGATEENRRCYQNSTVRLRLQWDLTMRRYYNCLKQTTTTILFRGNINSTILAVVLCRPFPERFESLEIPPNERFRDWVKRGTLTG